MTTNDHISNSENNYYEHQLKKIAKNTPNNSNHSEGYARAKKKQDPDREHIQNILHETDRNVNIIFKSSISNLENIMNGFEQPERKSQSNAQELLRENNILKSHLIKLKKILREKLDIGLSKQREQLSKILEEYISLITKLLQDKENLTNKIQQTEHEFQSLKDELATLKQSNTKLKKAIEERDQQIKNAKDKTTEFLAIIQQYQEEAVSQQTKFDQMNLKIQELEKRLSQSSNNNNDHQLQNPFIDSSNCYSSRVSNHSESKVQTLLYLFQESQLQNKQLKQQLTSLMNNKEQLEKDFQKRKRDIQNEYDEEFIQYQKVVKQSLNEKNIQIQRLNQTISLLKNSTISCRNCNKQFSTIS